MGCVYSLVACLIVWLGEDDVTFWMSLISAAPVFVVTWRWFGGRPSLDAASEPGISDWSSRLSDSVRPLHVRDRGVSIRPAFAFSLD